MDLPEKKAHVEGAEKRDVTTKDDAIIQVEDKSQKESAPSISFFILFRFSTPFERFLNILALIAAAAAGAAQPLLSLIAGNLTESFVSFGIAAQQQFLDPTSPTAQQAVKEAAKGFRHAAARDALFLVYIG